MLFTSCELKALVYNIPINVINTKLNEHFNKINNESN